LGDIVIKRLGLFTVILLTLLMAACNPFESDELKNEDEQFTNVEYSDDGKSVTIYLDGSAPVRANRSLNKWIAQLGYNFFEVTFCYNDGGTNKIVRASWELGEPAGISIPREMRDNVNYYGTNKVGIPATGQGTAVLFVGEKSDKTLLAVGTLSKIDNTDINPSGTNLITLGTTKVTFDLNALKAGVATTLGSDGNYGSFNTINYTQGTISNLPGQISNKDFPYFHLNPNSSVTARYKFSFQAALTHDYSFYRPAIIYAGGATASIIRPQWIFPPNIEKYESIYPFSNTIETTTFVDVTYPVSTDVNDEFTGTMLFTIRTAAEPSPAIAALVLRVPVYAVTSTDAPLGWFIKPGFGNYHRELDNGEQEMGGAVLLGIGITGGNPPTGIEIKGTSQKYYSPNFTFNLNGLQIIYRQGLNLTDITPPDPEVWWSRGDLSFFYDNTGDKFDDLNETDEPLPSNFVFGSKFYGKKVLIRVVYDTGTTTHETTFLVEVNNVAYTEIPYQHRVFLAKPNDFQQVANRVVNEGGGDWLFVFTESVNIRDMTFNQGTGAEAVIYMVATVPGVVIGRDSSTFQGNPSSGRISNNGTALVKIYIGSWPFNEPAFAGGDVITNYFFSINAGGTYDNFAGAPTATDYMFSGNLTVNILSDITVANKNWLVPP